MDGLLMVGGPIDGKRRAFPFSPKTVEFPTLQTSSIPVVVGPEMPEHYSIPFGSIVYTRRRFALGPHTWEFMAVDGLSNDRALRALVAGYKRPAGGSMARKPAVVASHKTPRPMPVVCVGGMNDGTMVVTPHPFVELQRAPGQANLERYMRVPLLPNGELDVFVSPDTEPRCLGELLLKGYRPAPVVKVD